MRRTLLSALVIALAAAAAAGAQGGGAPAPPCTGIAAADPSGDAVSSTPGNDVTPAPGPNLDITAIWFETSAGATTANIRVKHLDRTVPPTMGAAQWVIGWSFAGTNYYARARTDGTNVDYVWGVRDPGSGLYYERGTTTGRLFEGPDGVVQMVVPGETGGARTGGKLEQPDAGAAQARSVSGTVEQTSTVDRAPDQGAGTTYTVATCAPPPPAAAASGPPPPRAAGKPEGRLVQRGALVLRAAASAGSARAAARSKTVRIRLSTAKKTRIRKLTAVLFTGDITNPRIYGRGTLSSVRTKGVLAIKLIRKPRRGRYYLYLEGDNPDRQRASVQYEVLLVK